ncbi:MAG: UPF0175 family protein [Methanoregula sp.]
MPVHRRGAFSSGKACTVAGLIRWEWEELIGKRKIARHYEEKDLQQDLAYVRRRQ